MRLVKEDRMAAVTVGRTNQNSSYSSDLMGGEIRTRFLEVYAFYFGVSETVWILFKSGEADGRVCVMIPVQQLRSARRQVELHWQPAALKHCRLIHTRKQVQFYTKH